MRRRLMAAAAMGPLVLGAHAAFAQNPAYTLNGNSSTPVATNTAVSGGPGDIDFTSGTYTIKDATSTPAFTLNSNNNINNSGTITSSNVNNVTGIYVAPGGFTGNIATGGTIDLSETYTPSSKNNNGITDEPFAQGTNRVGIDVEGPLTGFVTNSGTITIQGNSSTGILINAPLKGAAISITSGLEGNGGAGGDLVNSGTISVTGDGSVGIKTTGEITGEVNITGAITMKGASSVGVQTTGPIDGRFLIYSSITTGGYAINVRETGQLLTTLENTPTDVEQGGSAVVIQGSVAGGVFLGAPPTSTVSTDTTTDADNDGIVDSAEGTSVLTTYGSAPALSIGGSNPITLGNFDSTVNPYGLTIEGTVSGQGLFDGVSATAVSIGGVNGAGVNLTGGLHVAASGNVNATAYQADATAIHLGAGVAGQAIFNQGLITSTVTSSGTNTSSGILIDAGAAIGALNNAGTIDAVEIGDSASVQAVVDHSGSISTVTNTGSILANLSPALPGEITTGKAIALDLSANTTGVTLLQTLGATSSTTPAIAGDVLLGSGQNSVDIEFGTLRGALSMGAAAGDSLTINNASIYQGALTYTGGSMVINVPWGQLLDTSPTTINASSLTVGSSSTLGVALDPVNNRSTLFNVSGAATFAQGAQITATLLSAPPLSGQTFTIVNSPALTVGTLSSSTLTVPYLFNGSLTTTADTIGIRIVPKTPAQMLLNKSETAAFNAIYADLPQSSTIAQDSGIQTAIIGAADRPTFVNAYDQLLPDSNGDIFNTALGMSKAVSRATADRFDLSTQKDDEDDDDFIVSGFWASEFYSGMEQNKVDNTAYHSAALGVIGGYDFGGTGFTIAAGSSNITRPHSEGDSLNAVSVVEGGAYAAPRFGALSLDARVGGGWLYVSETREFVAQIVSGDESNTSTVSTTAKGTWSGYDLSAHLGAGLQLDVSKHLFFQPKVYGDFFYMHENAYNERNGGAAYDLDVAQRNSMQTNGTASMVTGLRFGNQFVISPQLEVGYDKVISGGPADTTARFAYGGPSFTVGPNHIDGAAMARLTLRGDGNYVHFSLQAGGEYTSDYHSMDLKAVFRLTF